MWLTQNPAGFCRQWTHSWMVCGSSRGMVIVRRRGFAVAGAGQFWPAPTFTAVAGSWIEPPRLERLVCACRLFIVSSAFRYLRLEAPLRSGCRLGGPEPRWRGADAVLDEHERRAVDDRGDLCTLADQGG